MGTTGKPQVLGIERATKYSPNHIGNDRRILQRTAESLQQLGYEVETCTEDEFLQQQKRADYIFSMARSEQAIQRLKQLESEGAMVINSPYGVDNCIRKQMTELLIANDIPHPKSLIADLSEVSVEAIKQLGATTFWLKRGDSHAIHREDVSYARSVDEAMSIVEEFGYRGIPNVVINEHLQGDLVKFYGVADTDFFYWFYPYDAEHSKFGHEAINGRAKEFRFSPEDLKAACDRAGEILKVKVYGGDCIVDAQGNFRIIDFNDWPSFAPCRDEAGVKIAECIGKQIEKNAGK